VGSQRAHELLNDCLPLSAKMDFEIGMIDEMFEANNYFKSLNKFTQSLVKDEDTYSDFLYEKEDFLSKNSHMIEQKKEQELKVMHPEFWDEESSFHKLRSDFVYKVCSIQTPQRLKGEF
jgi:putative two-component system hydrogenase maturation factor HypX/HoxX